MSEDSGRSGLQPAIEHGAEYWCARDLQPLLGYSQWRRFEEAIKRAMVSCQQSGYVTQNHFASVGKMVELGSGSLRNVDGYHLPRSIRETEQIITLPALAM